MSASLTAQRATARETPWWVARLLQLPMFGKLAGANALIVVVATIVIGLLVHGAVPEPWVLTVVVIALGASLAVSTVLISMALQPLWNLEQVATQVSSGDLLARVEPSITADPAVARVGLTFNRLLDSVVADRERARRLAADVLEAGDRERAQISHELHDSVAQTLAAIGLQLSVLARTTEDAKLAAQAKELHELARDVLEQIRSLAKMAHPSALEDLGLAAALHNLASWARKPGVAVTVQIEGDARRLSHSATSVIYRIAQEAVAAALLHPSTTMIELRLVVSADDALLEVRDDGRIDATGSTGTFRQSVELFTMRKRVELVEGELELYSGKSGDNVVCAKIPLADGASPQASGKSRLRGSVSEPSKPR